MRILKGLSGECRTCGCLVGVYETYDGRVIRIVDVPSPDCHDPAHKMHQILHEPVHNDRFATHGVA